MPDEVQTLKKERCIEIIKAYNGSGMPNWAALDLERSAHRHTWRTSYSMDTCVAFCDANVYAPLICFWISSAVAAGVPSIFFGPGLHRAFTGGTTDTDDLIFDGSC